MSELHTLETSESNYPLMQCHIPQHIFTMNCTTKIWTLFYHYPKLCTQFIYSIHYTI